MKILLTGANGYIGMRLLPQLLENGHEVVCVVRDKNRLSLDAETLEKVEVVEADFLQAPGGTAIPADIEVAYYLIHSMGSSTRDFDKKRPWLRGISLPVSAPPA